MPTTPTAFSVTRLSSVSRSLRSLFRNPSGGLIGAGHPVGATGVRQMLDCHRQITHTAGDYQVENAKKFAMLNIGGSGTTSCVFIVGK